MKFLMLLAASTALIVAQDAKMVSPPLPPNATSERILTKSEIADFQVSALRIERLKTEYKIAEFNEKVKPHSDDQQTWYAAMCKSIGLTDEQIRAQECGLNIGVDIDGKPITGQDGKPLQSRVWHVKPAPPPVSEKK